MKGDPFQAIRDAMDGVRDYLGSPAKQMSSVAKCPRCGDPHRDIEFKKLFRASGENTHWATCPNTGEPLVAALRK